MSSGEFELVACTSCGNRYPAKTVIALSAQDEGQLMYGTGGFHEQNEIQRALAVIGAFGVLKKPPRGWAGA